MASAIFGLTLLAAPAAAIEQLPVIEGCGFQPFGHCPVASNNGGLPAAVPFCIIGMAGGVILAALLTPERELTEREAWTAIAFCGLGAIIVKATQKP